MGTDRDEPLERRQALLEDYLAEQDEAAKLKLKLQLAHEKVEEIHVSFNRYNDSAQLYGMNELKAFLCGKTEDPAFRGDRIGSCRYKGDWSR